MAKRFNLKHDQATREKIQTSQIINRLNKFIKGEVKMEPAQVTAALGLLKKSLPDLAHTQIDANHKGNLTVEIVKFGAHTAPGK